MPKGVKEGNRRLEETGEVTATQSPPPFLPGHAAAELNHATLNEVREERDAEPAGSVDRSIRTIRLAAENWQRGAQCQPALCLSRYKPFLPCLFKTRVVQLYQMALRERVQNQRGRK